MKHKFWLVESVRHSPEKRILPVLELLQAAAILASAFLAAIWVNAIFLAEKSLTETAPVLLVLFVVMATIPLLSRLRTRRLGRLSLSLRLSIRQRLHGKLLSREMMPEDVRSFLPHALDEVDALDLWFTRVLPVVLGVAVQMPLILVASFILDPITGLLMLVTVPISPFLLYLIGRVTKKASEDEWRRMERLSTAFGELLSALPTMKLFGAEAAQGWRVAKLSDAFSKAALKVLQLAFVSAFALELITTLSIAIIAVSVGLRLLYGRLDFTTAFFVLLITPEFFQPLRLAGTAFHSGMTAATAEGALKKVLGETDEAEGSDEPSAAAAQGEGTQQPRPMAETGSIVLSAADLAFAYPGAPLPVIKGASFTIPAGKLTAVKGPSGCGKSTLLSVLAGLETPYEGSIKLALAARSDTQPDDDAAMTIELSTLSADERAHLITYVPQEPHLLSGTLMENVTLLTDSPDEAKVRQALGLACLPADAPPFTDGLATMLGDGGQPLSEGQRKRLGLARALYQDRPLVILDEPTAALDSATAEEIRTSIREHLAGRTVILATHDEELIALADKILLWEAVETT